MTNNNKFTGPDNTPESNIFPEKRPKPNFLKNLLGSMAIEAIDRLPAMYKVGGKNTEEVYVNEKRALAWQLTGTEAKLAEIAGWNRLPHIIEAQPHGILFIPEGTRNARSILSGQEAYKGEKSAIIQAGVKYLKDSKEVYGGYDTNFNWAVLAVTPDHNYFVSPPHVINANQDSTLTAEWQTSLQSELQQLLENDEANQNLVDSLHNSLVEV